MKTIFSAVALSLALGGVASAGPIIIAGTDADDHGSNVGGTNNIGWLFMQKAFENLGPAVSNGNTSIVCLGCRVGGALNAFNSAIDLSSLAGAGWTHTAISGVTGITDFFNGVGATTLSNTGIIYMPTNSVQVVGGILDQDIGVINGFANALNTFTIAGGGLFTQSQSPSAVANGYGWLTTLLPGLIVHGDNDALVNPFDSGSLTLTPSGTAAFPGLTDALMSNATPWHNWFSGNFGSLQVLTTGPVHVGGLQNPYTQQAVILGGGVGGAILCGVPGAPACPSTTSTATAPEPTTMVLLGTGIAVAGLRRRFGKRRQ